MADNAVVHAGGSPTGLTLAGRVAVAGVAIVISDCRASHDVTAGAQAVYTHALSRLSIKRTVRFAAAMSLRNTMSGRTPTSRKPDRRLLRSPPAAAMGATPGRK